MKGSRKWSWKTADKPARWRSRTEDRSGAYCCVCEQRSGGAAPPAGRIVGRRWIENQPPKS